MNTPDPPHWTLNYRFAAFCTIWVHLGLFGCLTKLCAKRAELVQKFVPRSRVRIFRTERARSTPLDPKLTFWCVSYYLSAFEIIWLPYKTLRKTGGSFLHKFVPRSRIRSFCNEHIRSAPLDPKLTLWCISYHLGAFGTVCLPYETWGKTNCHEVALKFFATNAPDPPHCTLN